MVGAFTDNSSGFIKLLASENTIAARLRENIEQFTSTRASF
jgi:hypothetical protein